MIAVADTGPISYLILLGAQDILGKLFEEVLLPFEVSTELNHSKAPGSVREWVRSPPEWLKIASPTASTIAPKLYSAGELQAADIACIELAAGCSECTLLMDDRAARQEASARGVRTTGTLALLFRAGELGLLDFGDALNRLEQTTFRASAALRAHFRHQWENQRRHNP